MDTFQVLENIELYEKPEERCFLLMPLRHTFKLNNIYTCLHFVNKWIQEQYHKMYERFIKASCKKIYELNKDKIILDELDTSIHINDTYDKSILDLQCYQYLDKLKSIDKKNKMKICFNSQMKKYLSSIIIHFQSQNSEPITITVSISGGIDSCVCLYLLHDFVNSSQLYHNKIQIKAFMVDYSNRIEQSCEKEYVKNLCHILNVPFYVRHITELKRTTIKDRTFYEQYTKNIRYDCYKNVGDIIILGHNLDDCMENIINNIKKKINYNNLKGMDILTEENEICIFRPLLEIKKEELTKFAQEHYIPYVYDSTSKICERGKIRDQMIPFLNNFDKNIYEGLIQLSNNYYEIYKIYEHVFPKITFQEEDKIYNFNTDNSNTNIISNITIEIENQEIHFFDYWKRVFSFICKKLHIHYIKNKSIDNFIMNIKKKKKISIVLSKDLIIKNHLKYYKIIYKI